MRTLGIDRAHIGARSCAGFIALQQAPNVPCKLYPDFLLTAPVSIHIKIFDCRIDVPYPQYSGNRDAAAGVPPGDPINPKLLVFLPTLEVNGSLIKWTNYRETFQQIIIHEFLHLYGDVPGLRQGAVDGRIRHNMVGTGAIEPLINGLI